MALLAAPRGGLLVMAAARLFAATLLLALALPSEAGALELSAKDKEHYKNAFLHADKGRFRDARQHAARASNKLPAKVIQWLDLTRDDSSADFAEAMTARAHG